MRKKAKASENELRERIPVPHDNFFKIYLKFARVLRRLKFLSVVSMTSLGESRKMGVSNVLTGGGGGGGGTAVLMYTDARHLA